jgi:hypothetical protein
MPLSMSSASAPVFLRMPNKMPFGPGRTVPFTGEVLPKHFALPGFFFDATMTCAWPRRSGVEPGIPEDLGAP